VVDLVLWDVADGAEDRRVDLPADAWRYVRLDFDGNSVVLSRDQLADNESGELAEVLMEALRIDAVDRDAGIVSPTGVSGVASIAK
jgi:hypothetical protein